MEQNKHLHLYQGATLQLKEVNIWNERITWNQAKRLPNESQNKLEQKSFCCEVIGGIRKN